MSKLFDAITKLEAETSQGPIEVPFSADTEKTGASKKRLTKNILLGIVVFLVLSGLLAVYLTQNGPFLNVNKTFYAPPTIKKVHPVKKEIAPENVMANKNTANSNDNATKLPARNKSVSSSLNKTPLTFNREQIEGLEKKIQTLEKQKIAPKDHNPKREVQKTPLKKTESVKGIRLLQKRTPRILSFRDKKLLFQAERLRKEGDMISAIRLYKKIWERTQNPLVANNLAALLMKQERYREAKEILQKAIKLSPDDEDLRYNLEQLKGL